jgi:hypothetical protein
MGLRRHVNKLGPLIVGLGMATAVAAQSVPAGVDNAATLQRIDALLGSRTCSAEAQCRVIGVGARSCGGPESYHSYSTLDVDEAALRRLVAQHAEARLQAAQRGGETSLCDMQEPPTVICRFSPAPAAPGARGGVCTLVPAQRGAGMLHTH